MGADYNLSDVGRCGIFHLCVLSVLKMFWILEHLRF
jgi:hypothetical protein